jgi:hypothetical protein
LGAQTSLGARLFPDSINPGSRRALRASVLAKAGLSRPITEAIPPFVSAYFGLLENGFVARTHGFQFGLDQTPLRDQILNLGVNPMGADGGS